MGADKPRHITLDDVVARVAEIQAAATDAEHAHGLEDDLWMDVLRAIAAGRCDEPRVCAKAALRSRDIEFGRWCA